MLTRDDTARVARQNDLWEKFNSKAALMASGPEELKPLAEWIRHGAPDQEPGILVQQVIGEFFTPDFKATAESWQAAVTLREDARSRNLPKMLLWQILGKARQAKQLLGSMVSDDIYAMHGIGVAIHNIVASVRILRTLYQDQASRNTLTPEMAVRLSLSPPPRVLRQAVGKGVAGGCPFSKYTLFLLNLKDADKDKTANDLIFMDQTWSRCPAEQWVPALIAGTWKIVMDIS